MDHVNTGSPQIITYNKIAQVVNVNMSKYLFEKNENGATINIQLVSLEHLNTCRPEKYFLLSKLNIANQRNT